MTSDIVMQDATSKVTLISLVIAERGSDWAPWVDKLWSSSPHVVALVQKPGEGLADFGLRVRERLELHKDRAELIERAVLIGSSDTGPETIASRSVLVRALAGTMVRAGGGTIWLDGGNSTRSRVAMTALATTTNDQLRRSGVFVRTVDQEVTIRKVA